jgi:hypothetical protein
MLTALRVLRLADNGIGVGGVADGALTALRIWAVVTSAARGLLRFR